MKSLVCPISTQMIDSNVSRLTVFLNVILMALFIITLNPLYIIVVAIDYLIRAAFDIKYSPMRFIASSGIGLLNLEKKPINAAPKIFASRLGFVCALASASLILMGFTLASTIIVGLLMVLSIMDSIFNFCVGCLIYNYLVYPFYKNR